MTFTRATARCLTRFALAGGLLLCGSNSVPALAAEPPLTVSLVGVDYPPLIAQKYPNGGLLSHIVVEAFRRAEVETHIEYVPNNRAISGVMMGIYDGSYGWSHSPERDSKLLYSNNPIFNFRMVFFQRSGPEIAWKSLADLARYRIGATLGDHYSDEFSTLQASGKINVDYANDDVSNVRKLLAGRIDLFPMEESAARLLVKGNLSAQEQAKLHLQSTPFSTIPSYLVIRRNHPHAAELVERFDRGYKLLLQSGDLQKIIDQAELATPKAQR